MILGFGIIVRLGWHGHESGASACWASHNPELVCASRCIVIAVGMFAVGAEVSAGGCSAVHWTPHCIPNGLLSRGGRARSIGLVRLVRLGFGAGGLPRGTLLRVLSAPAVVIHMLPSRYDFSCLVLHHRLIVRGVTRNIRPASTADRFIVWLPGGIDQCAARWDSWLEGTVVDHA